LTGEARRAEEYPQGDFRRTDPRYQAENYDANLAAARTVGEIAAANQAKPGQIGPAWLLQKGDDMVPIPGTKRRKYLEENVAAETVQLDPAQMKVKSLSNGLSTRTCESIRRSASCRHQERNQRR
jgi:aryl-alcohol dehydrogenase-like predicted oxidoreductase